MGWPLPVVTEPVSYGEAALQVCFRPVRREHHVRANAWYVAGPGADAPRPRHGQSLASLLGVSNAGRGVPSRGRRAGQGIMEPMQELAYETRRTVPRRPRTACPAYRSLTSAGPIPLGNASGTHR
ncbi:hypothetical protein GCM10009754_00860 [Amycolatopsis minnesotensis]|uniref:Uncharacterized protein n=1 Tax=Amycolatopsis minnesotensis TaxID=337894 RepID=A0ABP5BCB5_9PSEU